MRVLSRNHRAATAVSDGLGIDVHNIYTCIYIYYNIYHAYACVGGARETNRCVERVKERLEYLERVGVREKRQPDRNLEDGFR